MIKLIGQGSAFSDLGVKFSHHRSMTIELAEGVKALFLFPVIRGGNDSLQLVIFPAKIQFGFEISESFFLQFDHCTSGFYPSFFYSPYWFLDSSFIRHSCRALKSINGSF